MKPLKNKIINPNDMYVDECINVKDVKSAVEWLKQFRPVENIDIISRCQSCDRHPETMFESMMKKYLCYDCLINEAFDDVMKPKEKKDER